MPLVCNTDSLVHICCLEIQTKIIPMTGTQKYFSDFEKVCGKSVECLHRLM